MKINDNLDEYQNTIPILKFYLESYVYRDVLVSPPEPFKHQAIDVIKELDLIQSKLPASGQNTYENAVDFYEDIMDIFRKLKDAQTWFTPPCFSNFIYALPYTLSLKSDENNKLIVVVSEPSISDILQKFNTEFPDQPDLSGKTVKTIKIGNEAVDAVTLLQDWGRKNAFTSKSNNSVLNQASIDFSERPAEFYAHPTQNISITYVDENESDKTVELPFYAYVIKSMTSLNDICPAKKAVSGDGATLFKQAQHTIWSQLERMIGHNRVPTENTRNAVDSKRQGKKMLSSFLKKVRMNDGTSLKVKYLKIHSFHPKDDAEKEEFVKSLMDNLTETQEAATKADKLVLDLRSNGGGDEMLGRYTLHLLFPEVFPLYPKLDMLHSEVNREYSRLIVDAQTNWSINAYASRRRKMNWFDGETVVVSTNLGDETRERVWTSPFTIDGTYANYFAAKIKEWKHKGKTLFKPNDVAVLSDGLCLGTCSQFVKHVSEAKVARVIGMGGKSQKDENAKSASDAEAFSVGGSSAFCSLTSDMVEAMRAMKGVNTLSLPSSFAREGARVSVAQMNAYSFDWQQNHATSEFIVTKPDITLPYYRSPASFGEDVYEELKKLFEEKDGPVDGCLDWMVQVNEENCRSFFSRNEEYGFACNTTSRSFPNTTTTGATCVFAQCERGYYLRNTGRCSMIPNYEYGPINPPYRPTWIDEEEKRAQKTTNAIVVVGIVMVVIGVIYMLAMCIAGIMKGRQLKNGDKGALMS
eukprot:MONOS_15780.1-p1 / transcript=MONOS_15780.1 / gene=MONOS_15780 / organism=Monocercomonoides_exilis_PA203 / gene_product=unspecified product / transcript_product=unspecified product / location=Mono_scaffold01353:8045-10359(+) / protein_length=751 / sequence_SO=supercontig / SO=protein_coding / is_pseudo=false